MNRDTYDKEVLTLSDLEASANKKLDNATAEYYGGGAMDLVTVRANMEAFNRYRIRPRILVNVDRVDMSVDFCGYKCAMPLGFSPTAFQKMAHPDGEGGTSRAAASAGIPMILSTYSTTSIEDVVKAGQGQGVYCMQLSVMKSRAANLEILKRAEARNDFRIPEHLDLPCLPADCNWRDLVTEDDRLKFDAGVTWQNLIGWARENTTMQIWLKGVYTAEDVVLAIDHGVDGVIVSNHGGRQLDTVTATLEALPECIEAAAGRIHVHVDSGFRRGTDIFKALALGASHVWLGRTALWGLAHNGTAGVSLAIKLLHDELRTAMALAGCSSIDKITRAHIGVIGQDGRVHRL